MRHPTRHSLQQSMLQLDRHLPQHIDRRAFLGGLGALAAAHALPGFAQGAAAPLVLNWYPGLLGNNFKRSFLDTWPQAAGVQTIESFDNARFTQMQANRAKPTSDVAVFIDVLLPIITRSGLVAKLDEKAIPNLARVDPALRGWDDLAFPVAYGSWGIVYNAKRVQRPITSWKDLLRDDLKGRVTHPNITYNSSVYSLDALARLGGGSLRQADEGMKSVRQIRTSGPGLWEQESVAVGWLKTEEIWATPYFSGNVLALGRDKDVPELRFVVPQEGAYFVPLNVTKVVNGPNPATADAFINHMLGAQAQEAWTKIGLSRAANRDVQPPKEVADTVPPIGQLRKVDWQYFGENRSAIVAKWNEIVNR